MRFAPSARSLSPVMFSGLTLLMLDVTACARADMPRAIAETVAAPSSEPSKSETHAGVAAAGATLAAASSQGEPALPPLDAPGFVELDLGGGEIAYAAVPVGAREKRAVFVGVHGAGDRADWSCSEWKATTADWAFVVCPRGVPHPSDKNAFVWGSAATIAARADRAVAALRERYGAWMSDAPLIYGGWSQGATLAAEVIASRPGVYDRVVLVEVGHTPLDAGVVVSRLQHAGVQRAVVSCSSGPCRSFAQDFERWARRRGLRVRVNDVGNRGHWFDEPVFRSLAPRVAWLVDDEPRFAGLAAAIDARWVTD